MENDLLRVNYYQEIIPSETGTPDFTIDAENLSEKSDDLFPGDYVAGALQGAFALDHPSFDRWRKTLALAALGYEAEKVWSSPEAFDGEPFFELIQCEKRSIFGPRTSAKLAQDFENSEELIEQKVVNLVNTAEVQFFMDIYQLFKKAFRVASNGGCTVFS
jgi:hypothetical protein